MASIIRIWKKFGAIRILSTDDFGPKLGNFGKRLVVSDVTKNPVVTMEQKVQKVQTKAFAQYKKTK